jgi:uncharacterized membrane protein YedE/YeeE
MMRLLTFFVLGALFAAGLVISGMTQPSKVVGFLDVTGNWDPSLALVMLGAVAVHASTYRLVRRRKSPLLALSFQVPTRSDIDAKLILGSALFGVGWGIAGYCPGPAITSLVALESNTLLFVGALLTSMIVYSVVTGKVSGVPNRKPEDRELGAPQVVEIGAKTLRTE